MCVYIQYSSLIDKSILGTDGFTDLLVMDVYLVSLSARREEGGGEIE